MKTAVTKESIREKIFLLADEEYRQFHSRLVPGEEMIIGVRVPVLRKYAKDLWKSWEETPEQLIELIGDDYYEEIMLQGMIIGLDRKTDMTWLFEQIDIFVPKIKNWAVCDIFCGGLKQTEKYKEEMKAFLEKYLHADEEYHIRFAVVMMLSYYIDEKYLDWIFETAESIVHEGYYVKMAVAWLISICFVKFYDKAKKFMQSCSLDDFTYNKALQKARESLRLSPLHKEELEKMKRKKTPGQNVVKKA